ncbi:cobalamin biosynthesis protein [Xanthomonas sp. WHRI 1810A]|uniref:cobalamin biosynthesis protein n=1 Tax=Xanthomonas sp. WHRI 1810A TaxID=3161565 RepID=UPI0032E8958D
MTATRLPPTLVAGIGCRRGCSAGSLQALIESSLTDHGLRIEAITALASINLKSSEPGLVELAEALGLPLVVFSADELARFEPQLSHRSMAAFEATGCYGVAESAALALASQLLNAPHRLLITRCKTRDATFALAGLL